jgi:multicomponent Na+:H+ antiporter subunit G
VIVDIVTVVVVGCGVFFLGVSAFSIVRFPDFFTRAHVVAKSETLGVMLVIVGVIVHHRGGEGTARLLLLGTFAMIANATAIHALARAALGDTDVTSAPTVPDDPRTSTPEAGR